MLFACRLCPDVCGTPVTGPVENASILLIGQAPGPREEAERRPFAYTAGKKLFAWFAERGVNEDAFRAHVWIGAVARCFPGRSPAGGDRPPSPEEIANCSAHLDREIRLLEPKLVIAVGTLASLELTGRSKLADAVGRIHRVERAGHCFDVVVLPHPSGRSTWLNREENRELLDRSLAIITGHEAWRETF